MALGQPYYDASLPLLVVKIGGYPLSHQGLAAIRSLGRVGVPVYTVTEDRLTPQAVSRFTRGRFVFPTTGREAPELLVARLNEMVDRIGVRTVALPTDDEAAILLAEQRGTLDPRLLIPAVPAELPRCLASKRGLFERCVALGVPTPWATFPATLSELHGVAEQARFPLVAKNVAAWDRLTNPVVLSTTIYETAPALLAAANQWPRVAGVMLQEYIPASKAEDWVFHGYADACSECLVAFSGVKYRSWPTRAGVTSYARAVPNARLEALSRDLIRCLGFAGVFDLDWRYDARDDSYNLVDFNPRAGANFRIFVNAAGVDVVRAAHLDLSGRPVPGGSARPGHGLVVEHLDLPSRLAWRSPRSATREVSHPPGPLEPAWWANDDPLPFAMMAARVGSYVAGKLVRGLVKRAPGSSA